MTRKESCLGRSVLLALGLALAIGQGAERQQLAGHRPGVAVGLAPVGQLDTNNRLHLAIILPLRDPADLQRLINDLYDPASPNFKHYLTADEFAARFGPTPEDYAAVMAFIRTNGLVVTGTHPNRTVLDVAGRVDAIEATLHTRLRLYRHPAENRVFFAPETEPAVDLATRVLRIQGLDNLHPPQPQSKRVPIEKGAAFTPSAGSGANGAFLGKDFRAAYAPGVILTGTGQILALVEFDGYFAADIATYQQKASLPSVALQNVLVDSFNGVPDSGNGEVALDIEVAAAMAPGLQKILVYEGGTNALPIDILNRIATDNSAKQISCSWTWGTYDPGTDQVFLQYAAHGQSFFQASGDTGPYLGDVPAPADNPYVTVVGGTTLFTRQSAWVGETAWNAGSGSATSGGSSALYALPTWQAGVNMRANLGSTSFRNLPDVAMIADNVMTVADNGVTYQVTGTSIGAPLWAAFTALANQQAVAGGLPLMGFLNPTLYSLGKGPDYLNAFHDVSDGDSTSGFSPDNFFALADYDLCTGWGTPRGSNTINLLIQVADRQLDHFSWTHVNSPATSNIPFNVTVTGRTADNNVATNFNGTARLSAVQTQTNVPFSRDFETGTLGDWTNEGGSYVRAIDATTGAAGTTHSLTLTGGDGTNSYNGLSHTLGGLSPDWMEFYVKGAASATTCGYVVAGASKFRTNSVFHFRLDGTGDMGLTDGPGNFYGTPWVANQWYKIGLQLIWTNRTINYFVNNALVLGNIPFCNTNLGSLAVMNLYNFDHTQAWWDEIRLIKATNTILALTSTNTLHFTNGVAAAAVSLASPGTNVTLTAADAAAHRGISNPFTIATNRAVVVTVAANPTTAGTVTGGGTFPGGSQQTLLASPGPGWDFTQWQDGNAQNPRSIVVPSTNITFTATFAQLPTLGNFSRDDALHRFTATVNGTSGSNYLIQVSTNLLNWAPLTTVPVLGGSAIFTDTNATTPWRFYRILGPP